MFTLAVALATSQDKLSARQHRLLVTTTLHHLLAQHSVAVLHKRDVKRGTRPLQRPVTRRAQHQTYGQPVIFWHKATASGSSPGAGGTDRCTAAAMRKMLGEVVSLATSSAQTMNAPIHSCTRARK